MADSGMPVWNESWALRPGDVKDLWTTMGTLNMSTGAGSQVVWRGMPSHTFEVKSSLIRRLGDKGVPITEQSVRAAEINSIQNARDWGIGVTEQGHASDLHLLAMMQHHGVPTRLIDVTYNPLTALWFACSDRHHRRAPGVLVGFMVRGTEVMKTVRAAAPPTWGSMEDPYGFEYSQALLETVERNRPVLVEPAVRDARMVAQEGLFITSGVPARPNAGTSPMAGLVEPKQIEFRPDLEKFLIGGEYATPQTTADAFGMLGILISPEIKAKILPVLEGNFNRSHRTMYPDLSGFSVHAGDKHLRAFKPDN